MSLNDYDDLFIEQEGVCKICKTADSKTTLTDNLVVDHDHSTGETRGLLCNTCNIALGHLDDSPELFKEAAKYLEETK